MSFDPSSFALGVEAPVGVPGPVTVGLGPDGGPAVIFQQEIGTREYSNAFAVLSVKNYMTNKILCATDHFLLASINEPDQERTSFQLTFGDPSFYAGLGRNPRIFSYGGFLVDSLSNGPNMTHWLWMYEQHLRGTMCARNKALVELRTRDLVRKGYMLSCALSVDSTRLRVASLSFNMFVIRES
jgi:hypothetical protein